jgi:hypothetical protein
VGGHGSGRGKAERDGGKGIGRVVVGGGESKPVRSQPSGFYDPGLPARGDSGCRERGSSEGQSWPISCPWRVRTGEEGAFPSHVLRYSHLISKHFAAIWQCYRPTRPSVTFLLKLTETRSELNAWKRKKPRTPRGGEEKEIDRARKLLCKHSGREIGKEIIKSGIGQRKTGTRERTNDDLRPSRESPEPGPCS